MSRVFSASVTDLFDAWVNQDKICQWFGCAQTKQAKPLEWNPIAGGKGLLEMQSCSEEGGPQGNLLLEFEEVTPSSRLVFGFSFLSAEGDADMPPGKVTVEFESLGDRSSEMTLTHEGLVAPEMRDMVTQGWGEGLDKLEKLFG